MKKVAAFILLIYYLVACSGVIINSHYCMNRLSSTELFAFESKRCEKCGMDIHKSSGCCRDEVKVVKLDEDQKLTATFSYVLPSLDIIGQELSDYIVTSVYNVPVTKHFLNHSPPLLSPQDIYLQNGVFRI